MTGSFAEFDPFDLKQSVEVLAQFRLATDIVGEVHQFVRVLGWLVPLVVVIFEGRIFRKQLGARVYGTGPVDTSADSVVAGVLRLTVEEAPHCVEIRSDWAASWAKNT